MTLNVTAMERQAEINHDFENILLGRAVGL
jgi:hypothetical protein